MKIEHIAMYVKDLEKTKTFLQFLHYFLQILIFFNFSYLLIYK